MDNFGTFICVDIESAGPIPSQFALLSIGACTFSNPRRTFYVELIPDKESTDPRAMEINRLDIEQLRQKGLSPFEALQNFQEWLIEVVPQGKTPLMVAFNAPFDWMFINDYFLRYLSQNPFGHSAVDIKALYLGASGKSWQETSGAYLHRRYNKGKMISHNALDDAIDQAVIFEGILEEFFNLIV